MKVQGGRKAYDDINITPMLDLAYVLLVIFIILTTASVQGIEVDLPQASSSVPLKAAETKAITVADTGEIYYDAIPVTMAQLEENLRSQKALTPEFPVVVKGDSAVQYGKVVEVLDLLRRLEIKKFGLVASKPTGS